MAKNNDHRNFSRTTDERDFNHSLDRLEASEERQTAFEDAGSVYAANKGSAFLVDSVNQDEAESDEGELSAPYEPEGSGADSYDVSITMPTKNSGIVILDDKGFPVKYMRDGISYIIKLTRAGQEHDVND